MMQDCKRGGGWGFPSSFNSMVGLSIIDEEVKKKLLQGGFSFIGSYGKVEETEDGKVWGKEWVEAMNIIKRIGNHCILYCDGGILAVVAEHDWLIIPTKGDLHNADNEKLMSDTKAIAFAVKTIAEAVSAGIPGQLFKQ